MKICTKNNHDLGYILDMPFFIEKKEGKKYGMD